MKRFARWTITVAAIAVLGLGADAFRVASGSTQSKSSARTADVAVYLSGLGWVTLLGAVTVDTLPGELTKSREMMRRRRDLRSGSPTPSSARSGPGSPARQGTSALCPLGPGSPAATPPTSLRIRGVVRPRREWPARSPRHLYSLPRSMEQRRQRGELRRPDRSRPLAGNWNAVSDEQEPARPGLVPIAARPTQRALEIADHETDPHAPHAAIVRRNHLDQRLAEPGGGLADLGRGGHPVGGRDQDVLRDPAMRLQHQRPAKQRLDAEPGRRHRVVPDLKPQELIGRREGRRRSGGPRARPL